MKLHIDSQRYIDTNEPLDISMPLMASEDNPRAWYVDSPRMEPVRANGFVGSVAEGGNVNFRDIYFNPHGHGTHTECLGHITEKVHSVNTSLKTYFFTAELISLEPEEILRQDGTVDRVITKDQLRAKLNAIQTEALVIRTYPNDNEKEHRNYSGTNPPYIDIEGIAVLNEAGVKHLLIDLPSVDRELDEGALAFHHAFWKVPETPEYHKTITELIFVKDEIKDGAYILNIQLAPFENDASPSRPVLYKIKKG